MSTYLGRIDEERASSVLSKAKDKMDDDEVVGVDLLVAAASNPEVPDFDGAVQLLLLRQQQSSTFLGDNQQTGAYHGVQLEVDELTNGNEKEDDDAVTVV